MNGPESYCTQDEIKKIFSNIEAILALNRSLLESLQERYEKWNDHQTIGDVFLQFVITKQKYSIL